jgi:hypothetical protein
LVRPGDTNQNIRFNIIGKAIIKPIIREDHKVAENASPGLTKIN